MHRFHLTRPPPGGSQAEVYFGDAWSEGEASPTAKPPGRSKRERRRPDPLADVTEQLRGWFEDEPWSTNSQLLEKLQEAHPDEYPDNLLRTLHHAGEGR